MVLHYTVLRLFYEIAPTNGSVRFEGRASGGRGAFIAYRQISVCWVICAQYRNSVIRRRSFSNNKNNGTRTPTSIKRFVRRDVGAASRAPIQINFALVADNDTFCRSRLFLAFTASHFARYGTPLFGIQIEIVWHAHTAQNHTHAHRRWRARDHSGRYIRTTKVLAQFRFYWLRLPISCALIKNKPQTY